tara:strand:- start:138 stop:410 length:273 start_codon:yes stop_codon:yes gene_type:complete
VPSVNNLTQILNIALRTELLESLGWDESKLSQLESYLEVEFENFNLKSPQVIILEIKDHFGEDTAIIIERLFKEQFKSLLLANGGDINEH